LIFLGFITKSNKLTFSPSFLLSTFGKEIFQQKNLDNLLLQDKMYDRHHHNNHKEEADRHDDNPCRVRKVSRGYSLFRHTPSRSSSITVLFT